MAGAHWFPARFSLQLATKSQQLNKASHANYSPFRLPARLPDKAGFFDPAAQRVSSNNWSFVAARSIKKSDPAFIDLAAGKYFLQPEMFLKRPDRFHRHLSATHRFKRRNCLLPLAHCAFPC